jgi:hypothetical protein
MAENKKPVHGVIATAELQNRKDNGYANWNITLKDGEEYAGLSVPPNGPETLSKGMKVTMWPGKFTKPGKTFGYTLQVEKEEDEAPKAKSKAPVQENDESNPKSGTKDNYWNAKTEYEQETKDPRMARQKWCELVLSTYNAALPFLDQKPVDSDELDQYIDSAVAKAIALWETDSKR